MSNFESFGVLVEDKELKKFIVELCANLGLDQSDIKETILNGCYGYIFIDNLFSDDIRQCFLDASMNGSKMKILDINQFILEVRKLAEQIERVKEMKALKVGEYQVDFYDNHLKVGYQKVDYSMVERIWKEVSRRLE